MCKVILQVYVWVKLGFWTFYWAMKWIYQAGGQAIGLNLFKIVFINKSTYREALRKMMLCCINYLFLLVSPSFLKIFVCVCVWRRERWGLEKRTGLKPPKQNSRVCPEMWRQTEGLTCSERWPELAVICTAPFYNNFSSWNKFYFFFTRISFWVQWSWYWNLVMRWLLPWILIVASTHQVILIIWFNSNVHTNFWFILSMVFKITGYGLQIIRIWDI